MKTVGLIGCGAISKMQYAGVLRSFFKDSAKLFNDLYPVSAEMLALALNGESVPLEELIQRADFIIIATPPDSHFELLKQSCNPGKSVLCEKPFLMSSVNVYEIINLATQNESKIYAAHVRRFFAAVVAARKFYKTGLLGRVIQTDIFEGFRFSWKSQSGYPSKSVLGGVLPDTGSHALDSLLYILGLDTEDASFELKKRSRAPETEPSHVFKANFTIESKSVNANATLHLSRRNFLSNKINIYFENGVMEVPLDLKNSVKVSTKTGTVILHEANPVRSTDDAFNEQFRHILFDNGEILLARRFINTTKLLDLLING